MTSVVIYSIVTLGLGLLIGRVGMVSLCQFALLAVGAWVALRLDYATSIPFPLLLLIAGVVTGVIGTLIGLPALRLTGLYLALITLMAAGAIGVVLRVAQFPNGGGGFFGNTAGRWIVVAPPATGDGDGGTAYYRYCVIVAVLMFLLALWHVRGKAGRAWAAIRQSQPTALAAGREHDALQALGVRARVVHGRSGGRPPGRRHRRSQRQPVPDPELDHPPRRRPDGRHLQHLGRDRRRAAAATAARRCSTTGASRRSC